MLTYLQKRSPDQPYWGYAALQPRRVHPALLELVTRNRTPIGPCEARRVFEELEDLGFARGFPGVGDMPVELVDFDGVPVEVADPLLHPA